ncbi:hypothetical protein BKK79_27765 [Cupriavidus sp. USMAA2-4]|uniref:Uncharacterized protein n=1 Tax=Cupriavidus malaysiensis TaxID=367825 RepID=A0ABN4TNY1_9BURK|nr:MULTISPECIES: DUF6616 family protein [Cupriavidus]AOY95544.1 hypothetical protein BKK79_27765 [Cupriavidus sp. USMAA2-4]AOZ01570.1 hypothetical protein BKK81_19420 [Cupriavidus sp. USMAHM13]AOZ08703.1 hypothetical protein BKK80_22525 [Cupriavidus malaysiensis]
MTTSGHHYLVELYTPKPAWRTLAPEQRERFLAGIAQGMQGLGALGIEILSLGRADAGVERAAGHRYLGIWRCADAAARDALLAGIEASGWYGYFEHVNAAGGGGGLASHLAELAGD